jgi:hypothetical protein
LYYDSTKSKVLPQHTATQAREPRLIRAAVRKTCTADDTTLPRATSFSKQKKRASMRSAGAGLSVVLAAVLAPSAQAQGCDIGAVFVRLPPQSPLGLAACVCVRACVRLTLRSSAQGHLAVITDSAGPCCSVPGSCSDGGFPNEADACPEDCGVVFEPFWDECGAA